MGGLVLVRPYRECRGLDRPYRCIRPPRHLTDSAHPAAPRAISPDGRLVVVARSQDLNEHDQLHLLDVATGAETALTQFQTDHYVFGGRFSPDRRHIAWVADCVEATGVVTPGALVYLHDLRAGETCVLMQTEGPFETGVEWSPSGRFLLWQRMQVPAGTTALWVLPLEGVAREVLALGDRVAQRGDWVEDERIAVVADGAVHDRVGVLHWRTGQVVGWPKRPG